MLKGYPTEQTEDCKSTAQSISSVISLLSVTFADKQDIKYYVVNECLIINLFTLVGSRKAKKLLV